MLDVVIPFLLLVAIGAVGALALADVLRRKKLITSRVVPAALYVLVLVLVCKQIF